MIRIGQLADITDKLSLSQSVLLSGVLIAINLPEMPGLFMLWRQNRNLPSRHAKTVVQLAVM